MGHPCTAGTTAALVIIRGNKLYVAHVGDSAVFMGTSVSDESTVINCKELTEDHKPESTKYQLKTCMDAHQRNWQSLTNCLNEDCSDNDWDDVFIS